MLFQIIKEETNVLATNTACSTSITKPGQFIMDGAAGVSVANETSWMREDTTLMRLPPGAANLSGVGGDKTMVSAVSSLFKPFNHMKVNHAVSSVANILSVPDLQERYFVHYRDQKLPTDRMEISTDPSGIHIIATAPKDIETRFYMLQAPAPASEMMTTECAGSNTATPVLNIYSDAYAKGWSKNMIERAMKVRDLHRAFSYVGLERIKDLVRSNRFSDVGPNEVSLYQELHAAGDCGACQLGKTVRSDQTKPPYTRATSIGELIIADIVEIKSARLKSNKLAIITVDDKSGYTHVRPLDKKDIRSVKEAFTEIVNDYKSFNWTVGAIKLDGDGTFREIANHIAMPLGVKIIPTTPYKHAVIAERMIRTLTTLFRCTIAGLPYVLAPHMFTSLLEFCASSNNLIPNSNNPVISPTEQYTKRSPEYEKLIKIEYGKLVTYHRNSVQNDDMRANVGVIVGRDVRRPGNALLWDLIHGGAVVRNDFKPLVWNQALMKAYIDTAMGSHDASNVDHMVYYQPSDIELSSKEIEELCENDNAEPGSLPCHEGVIIDEYKDDIDLKRSKEEHKKALLRLIDVANASGELLESQEYDNNNIPVLDDEDQISNSQCHASNDDNDDHKDNTAGEDVDQTSELTTNTKNAETIKNTKEVKWADIVTARKQL